MRGAILTRFRFEKVARWLRHGTDDGNAYQATLETILAHDAAQRAEIERLLADRERLEWLGQYLLNGNLIHRDVRMTGNRKIAFGAVEAGPTIGYGSLREAIDAARAKEKT